MESKVSSKCQVVIPKEVREKLGVGPGDSVKFELIEGKGVLIRPAQKPPPSVLVRAGEKFVDEALREAKRVDERKIRRLLASLGVKN